MVWIVALNGGGGGGGGGGVSAMYSFVPRLSPTPFLAANMTFEPGGSKFTSAARNGAGDGLGTRLHTLDMYSEHRGVGSKLVLVWRWFARGARANFFK